MKRSQALVIGIGNRLRSDDGAGIHVAEAIKAQPTGMHVVLCDQLTPELAECISQARAVLFVDAQMSEADHAPAQSPSAAQLQPLEALASGDPGGHALTPPRLLALSAALYGPCPPAWQLLIPGEQWHVGDQLSARTAAACSNALPLVLAWGARHA
ncbi:hydrogenase maturation protease [Vulcanococcus sp. Clear-D1]|uniref:hydrogenase maturation protease n=1 Tax=Vulcanococcus sp. Clear-D1 TaxID=2766970 RepID=UPI0019B96BB9|nr:hydrogenase maturation protease [Vulcanococcus sp. Clear-D1]MBD1195219.1 hydrogenase maturation protease [Vulcanococcus sp. Clear-D1]